MTIRRLALALPALFAGWISVLLIVALISDEAPAYVVLAPSAAFLENLPDDTAILAASAISITVTADTPHFARRLYGHGARIVLPAGLPGCLPLPQTK